MSVLVAMNLTTLVLFLHGLTEMHWHRILPNLPLTVFGIFALVGFNFWLIERMQRAGAHSSDVETSGARETRIPLWLRYLWISVVSFVAAILFATYH